MSVTKLQIGEENVHCIESTITPLKQTPNKLQSSKHINSQKINSRILDEITALELKQSPKMNGLDNRRQSCIEQAQNCSNEPPDLIIITNMPIKANMQPGPELQKVIKECYSSQFKRIQYKNERWVYNKFLWGRISKQKDSSSGTNFESSSSGNNKRMFSSLDSNLVSTTAQDLLFI